MLLRTITSLPPLSSSTRELGLYAAVALIVPGGSLIAFFMLALRHRGWLTSPNWRTVFRIAALGTSLIFPG